MVNKRLLLCVLVLACVLGVSVSSVWAWTGVYHLEHEWAKIWIYQDGTIDLYYNITLKLDSGDNINYVLVGQPNGDFTIENATDQYGNSLTVADASQGSDYKVRVSLNSPLRAGQTVWFTLMTNVAHMIWEDNTTNVGMQFTPTWWNDAKVYDLRILIVLPVNVTVGSVATTSVFWNSTGVEDGRVTVYWEKQMLPEGERYPIGVSFPKGNVQYDTPSGIVVFFQQYGVALLAFALIIVFVGVGIYIAKRKPYLTPKISMETLGVRRGLTAVEASYLLDMEPTRVVTEMLYSLLQKRAVWVEAAKPLKLKVMPQFQDKTGTAETPLRYYEIDFLKAIKEDGTLGEEELAQTVMSLRDNVEEKMRGYRRGDTVDYYRKIVDKAWEQVEQAGTPELASNAYDEQLLWLLLDPNYSRHTEIAFHNRIFQPSPLWFWYWYGYQHYSPNPTYTPNVQVPAQSAKPPTIPGADFANNVATAVENTSNNIVGNLEKFANAIIPTSGAGASHEPARNDASCVCACHACACACACVSCACACAGGGVG